MRASRGPRKSGVSTVLVKFSKFLRRLFFECCSADSDLRESLRLSDLRSWHGSRNTEGENCSALPALRAAAHLNGALILSDEIIRYPEAKSCTHIRLGAEKGLKDAGQVSRRNSGAKVPDRNFNCLVLTQRR